MKCRNDGKWISRTWKVVIKDDEKMSWFDSVNFDCRLLGLRLEMMRNERSISNSGILASTRNKVGNERRMILELEK